MSDLLKGFKKIHATKTHTIFAHPDGHELRVANASLKAPERNEMRGLPLTKMSRGGNVDEPENPPTTVLGGGFSKGKTPENMKLYVANNYADGGNVTIPMMPGIIQPGNIDLSNRPRVRNPNGSISTVRSAGVNIGGREVLLPTVSPSGENLTVPQAIDLYRRTGQHLGMFATPEDSTNYAQSLHEQQAGTLTPEDFIQNKARGGRVQNYAYGSPDGVQEDPSFIQGYQNTPEGVPMAIMPPMSQELPPNAMGSGDMGPPSLPSADISSAIQALRSNPSPALSAKQQADIKQQEDQASGNDINTPRNAIPLIAAGQQAGQASPDMANLFQDAYNTQMGGFGMQEAGELGKAAAIGKQGSAEVSAAQNLVKSMQALQQNQEVERNAIRNEDQRLSKAYEEGQINPNRLFENMSVPKKITTAIGFMLGSMGSAVTGQKNPAQVFLEKQLDADIEAQKANMDKQHNLMRANFERYGNMRQAYNATASQLATIYRGQIQKAVSQNKGAIASADALNAIGGFERLRAPYEMENARMRAFTGVAKSNPAAAIDMLYAGNPKKAEEAKKELATYQEDLADHKEVSDVFNELRQKQTMASVLGHPIDMPAEVAQAKARLLTQALKRSPSKRLSDQVAKDFINPLSPKLLNSPEAVNTMEQGFHNFMNANSKATPNLDEMQVYGVKFPKYQSIRPKGKMR